jgi:hypothetical protein
VQVLTYLNQYMLRLGFVNCVCAVAQRELDSLDSLNRRFDQLVFRRVYEDESEFAGLLSDIDSEALNALQTLPTRRVDLEFPRLIAGQATQARSWYFIGELWVALKDVPSHVGFPNAHHSADYIKLARSLGLILDNYALSEIGSIIHWRLNEGSNVPADLKAGTNPIAIHSDGVVRLCLLYAVLSHDILAPSILVGLSTDGASTITDYLRDAAEQLLATLSRDASLEDILLLKETHKYCERLESQPVRRNQLRPRLEHYIDLGLLHRGHGVSHSLSESGYRLAADSTNIRKAFSGLIEEPLKQERWMDTEFFGAAGLLYDQELRDPRDLEVLQYFVRAFPVVKREIGFTPGRTVALLAGINAWQNGIRLEIARTYDAVYAAAKGPYSKYLQFSGGSRSDREFLISVRPEVQVALG